MVAVQRKRNTKKGFTLVELIVVIVIILVLAAAVVPWIMRHITNAKKVPCQSNRRALIYDLVDALAMDEAHTVRDLQQMADDSEIKCPEGGTYTVMCTGDPLENTDTLQIVCDKHKDSISGDGGSTPANPNAASLGLWGDFQKFAEQSSQKKNSALREAFLKEYGGQWPTLTVDGETYYIQPFYSESADSSLPMEQRTWLYATKDSGTASNWSVPYVFDPVTQEWYGATKWNGSAGGSANILSKDADTLHDTIANSTHNGTDRPTWKKVEKFQEDVPGK
nr:prepilin-type N-terminal cleavage/methylation domain-containing protein [Lientehia hominis]